MRIREAAFNEVGMRVASARARAFAATLGEAADAERGAESGTGSTRWAWRAADRVTAALSRCELGELVCDLGLGAAAFAGVDSTDPADPTRAVLRHLLRDRLVDVLRVSAGCRPFWCWPTLARDDAGGDGRGP